MVNKLILKKYNKTQFLIILASYLIVEAVLYSIYMAIDIFEQSNTVAIKYISIAICFIFLCAIFNKNNFDLDYLTVIIALFFTLIADLFLLVLNEKFIIGLIFFNLTQFTYFLRIYFAINFKTINYGNIKISVLIRIILIALIFILLLFLNINDITFYLAATYFINLIGNMVDSFRLSKNNFSLKIFGVALIIFILCDINVGLFNIGVNLLPQNLYLIVSLGMWFFYLPSQVLITLSVFCKKGIENENI